jgi:hypothetical protein
MFWQLVAFPLCVFSILPHPCLEHESATDAPHPLKNDPKQSTKHTLFINKGCLLFALFASNICFRYERYSLYESLSFPIHDSSMATPHQQPQMVLSPDTKPSRNTVHQQA